MSFSFNWIDFWKGVILVWNFELPEGEKIGQYFLRQTEKVVVWKPCFPFLLQFAVAKCQELYWHQSTSFWTGVSSNCFGVSFIFNHGQYHKWVLRQSLHFLQRKKKLHLLSLSSSLSKSISFFWLSRHSF